LGILILSSSNTPCVIPPEPTGHLFETRCRKEAADLDAGVVGSASW